MKVAVPVASATGRKVRAEISGQHQFDGEHHTADRRVEGRGDAGACTGGDQRDALPGRHGDELTERGAKRSADLDDRSLAADRRARTDRDRRRERLHRGDDRTDLALPVIDRIHHLGYAVSARFRRKILHQEGHDHAAGDRHQDDQSAPRARRREQIGVVVEGEDAEKGDVMDEPDQGAEEDRSDPGDAANDDSENR